MPGTLPGPVGWQGRRSGEDYRRTLRRLRELDDWAARHALLDPSARAIWLTIAWADLEGTPLTMADLLRNAGTTRHAAVKVLAGAAARRLLDVARSRRDGRHKTVVLTPDGRRFLVDALDSIPPTFQESNI